MLPCLDKDLGGLYYQFNRPEVLALIPGGARRLLDVGCGAGSLGATVKSRQECFYCGIEPDDQAAAEAHRRLDHVYHTTIERFNEPDLLASFDCIILADILEHTHDPLSVLSACLDYLANNGCIILSVPNIAHPQIIQELSSGLFRYTSAGILDSSHLRFFTRISIQQLLTAAGLHVSSIRLHPAETDPQQFLIVAKPVHEYADESTIGILIPHYQTLPLLKHCVSSIRAGTYRDYTIFILDQASTPESRAWLAAQPDICVIDSPVNFGFPIGLNLLLASCPCEWILILNSDVYIPKYSLDRLFSLAMPCHHAQLFGPVGMHVSGPQRISTQIFNSISALESFTNQLFTTHGSATRKLHRLVFFATLIHSSVFKAVGILDERFTPGNFEDDDFCVRAIQAGFDLRYAPGIYFHHYGSATFRSHSINFSGIMHRNHHYFLGKHAHHLQATLTRFYGTR